MPLPGTSFSYVRAQPTEIALNAIARSRKLAYTYLKMPARGNYPIVREDTHGVLLVT
jgi:hypothetical protein